MLGQKPNVQSLHSTVLPEEELDGYRSEFDLALSDPDITNIAISGPFGAGKSTIVDSWEHNHVQQGSSSSWVHVSLAEFQGEKERNLEGELINQLAYKLGNEASPKARFSVTRDAPIALDLLKSIFITIFIALTIAQLRRNDAPWSMLSPLFSTLISLAWVACLAGIVYQIIRRNQIGRTFKRLKFLNAEVEMFDANSSKDAFDRYLDDIVYLLSTTGAEVVVFEDLDRFGNVSIFEKLRRANDLANARRCGAKQKHRFIPTNKKGPIRFIYLVRDGLFSDPKDRTKFFDLIIPVIPFVDPNNSLDVLKKGFAGTGVLPTDEFLYQLSLYIDDPRVLKDICNESQHYKNELLGDRSGGDERAGFWSDDCLVAMMAYKALFPEDFERLQVRDGYVFSRFQKKRELIEEATANKTSEIEELNKELSDIEQRTKLSEDELTFLYLNIREDGRRDLGEIVHYDRTNYKTIEDFLSKVFGEKDRNDDLVRDIDALKDSTTRNQVFLDRISEVSAESESKSELIRTKIASLNEEILDLNRESLKELLANDVDVDKFLLGDDGKPSPLADSHYFPMLRFLLVQGYINESYQIYISHRYNESLTPADEDFLLSLLGNSQTSASLKLENPSAIVMRLTSGMLASGKARNWSLFKWLSLSADGGKDGDKLASFVRGVQHDHDVSFVCSYVLSRLCVECAITALVTYYGDCLEDVLAAEDIGDNEKRAFCHKLMGFSSADPLVDAARDSLRNYASHDDKFLELELGLDESCIPTIEQRLDDIDYEAQTIDFSVSNQELLEYVAEKGLFVPTASNVLGLASALAGTTINASDINSWLVSVSDETCVSFREHVLESKNLFISSLIGMLHDHLGLRDEDHAVAMILNGQPLEEDNLNKYVSSLEKRVTDLSLINSSDARSELVSEMKCVNTPANIATYLENPGFDDRLAMFLETDGIPDDLTQTFLENSGIDSVGFIRDCTASETLSKKALEKVAIGYRGTIGNIHLNGLADDRIKVLINSNVLSVTKANLLSLRDHQDLVPVFASKDLDSYVHLVTPTGEAPCDFLKDEVLGLLGMPGLDADLLNQLAKCLQGDVPLSSRYPDNVNLTLLSKKGFRSSFDELPGVFPSAGGTLRDEIADIIANYFDDFCDAAMSNDLERAVVERLKNSPREEKLFITSRVNFSRDSTSREHLRELFELSNLGDYVALLDGPSSWIEDTDEDNELVESLQSIRMCGTLRRRGEGEKMLVYSMGYSRSGVTTRKKLVD